MTPLRATEPYRVSPAVVRTGGSNKGNALGFLNNVGTKLFEAEGIVLTSKNDFDDSRQHGGRFGIRLILASQPAESTGQSSFPLAPLPQTRPPGARPHPRRAPAPPARALRPHARAHAESAPPR